MLLSLKLKIVEVDRTQSRAARALGMSDSRLSRILNGFDALRDDERERIIKRYGNVPLPQDAADADSRR